MSELEKYKEMYLELFHAVTTTISMLDFTRNELKNTTGLQKEKMLEEKMELAILSLRESQQKAEQIFIED